MQGWESAGATVGTGGVEVGLTQVVISTIAVKLPLEGTVNV